MVCYSIMMILSLSTYILGTNIARSLSSLPPNILHPESYSQAIRQMSQSYQWEYSEWRAKELKDLGKHC